MILAISCLSPLILFAQDLSVSPATQVMQERRRESSDIGLSQPLRPPGRIPDMPWGKESSDIRLGQFLTTTEHQGHSGSAIAVVKVTVIDNEEHTELPEELLVQGNYPNPFRDAARIVFHLPEQAQVYAEVFDILGRVIYTSQVQQLNAGRDRTLSLDLSTTSSGMYIYRVNVTTASGTLTRTGRMIQIR
ncbi:MAG: T9SS type A sorting domain-containing protein [Bacteroidetes bacterium]|nr:T9SS type A sorting domain-containing protein [Bacteroidota bacterium]